MPGCGVTRGSHRSTVTRARAPRQVVAYYSAVAHEPNIVESYSRAPGDAPGDSVDESADEDQDEGERPAAAAVWFGRIVVSEIEEA